MAGAMARIDDGAWTAIKHTNAFFDQDQQFVVGEHPQCRGARVASRRPGRVVAHHRPGRMTPRHSLSAEFVDDSGHDSVGLDLTP
jgi:hypothetical protein